MVQFWGLFNGFLISLMSLCNSKLSDLWGNYTANVYIHFTGLCFILLFCFKKLRFPKGIPLWCFLGGAIGILTVLFSNITVGILGVTVTLVLSLLGQTVTSIIIDQFGLFGFPKYRCNRNKLISIGLIGLGAAVMILW